MLWVAKLASIQPTRRSDPDERRRVNCAGALTLLRLAGAHFDAGYDAVLGAGYAAGLDPDFGFRFDMDQLALLCGARWRGLARSLPTR